MKKLTSLFSALLFVGVVAANDSSRLNPPQQTAVADVNRRSAELKAVNKAIWEFAEVGLQEKKSSALLIDKLKSAGFKIQSGVSGMPTAFVATAGSGKPIIGILAEYDALPGMSQKVDFNAIDGEESLL